MLPHFLDPYIQANRNTVQCILGWTTESLLDWGQFIKLGLAGMVMICIEWWSFEVGSFLAGTVLLNLS